MWTCNLLKTKYFHGVSSALHQKSLLHKKGGNLHKKSGGFLRRNTSDFSVVLFRPHCMLVSEKNHVKELKNQWIWSMPYPSKRLSGATRRGPTTAPEVQTPSQ